MKNILRSRSFRFYGFSIVLALAAIPALSRASSFTRPVTRDGRLIRATYENAHEYCRSWGFHYGAEDRGMSAETLDIRTAPSEVFEIAMSLSPKGFTVGRAFCDTKKQKCPETIQMLHCLPNP